MAVVSQGVVNELKTIAELDTVAIYGALWDDDIEVLIITDKQKLDYTNFVISGIEVWQEKLEEAYPNGTWNINISIYDEARDQIDLHTRDVMILLREGGEYSCERDFKGVTWYNQHEHGYIMSEILITDSCNSEIPRSPQDVKSIAAHEFGHALGLGHTKIDYDLMCNGECEQIDYVVTPSEINIESVYKMYGDDGFKSPNPIPFKLSNVENDFRR